MTGVLKDHLQEGDKEAIEEAVEAALKWLREKKIYELEDFKNKVKDLQNAATKPLGRL